MIISAPNLVPADLISAVRDRASIWLEQNPNIKNVGSYNRMGKSVRISDEPFFAEEDKKLSAFLGTFFQTVVAPRFTPQFSTGDSGFEYHIYAPGESCLVHTDGITDLNSSSHAGLLRFATVIMHLNTVSEGGLTVFPNQNQSFKTVAGQVLVFPPDGVYPHYVTPSEEPREIVMTWLVYSGLNVVRY